MQRLALADQFFADVISGAKTNTMRWREVRITEGPLCFYSEAGAYSDVVVTVVQCTDVALRDAAALVGIEAEWPERKMLGGMRAHYPDITLDSTVQVICYDPPET